MWNKGDYLIIKKKKKKTKKHVIETPIFNMPIRRTDKKPPVSSVESVYEFSEGDMNIEFIDYRLPRYRFRGSRACTALSALREEKRAVRPAGMRRAEQARRNTGCTCRRCLAAALLYPTYPFPNIHRATDFYPLA